MKSVGASYKLAFAGLFVEFLGTINALKISDRWFTFYDAKSVKK